MSSICIPVQGGERKVIKQSRGGGLEKRIGGGGGCCSCNFAGFGSYGGIRNLVYRGGLGF